MGVDLDKIAQLNPETAPAICDLREDLRTATEKEVAPWELQRLEAHASLQATRVAAESDGVAGLSFLEEVAQDFPSGWAHALVGKSAQDDQLARDLMKNASGFPAAGLLEINGWRVPEPRQGLLSLLQSQSPLFYAAEQLGVEGFDQKKVIELIRDSREGSFSADRVATADPRLPGSDRSSDAVVLFDVNTDSETDSWRNSDTFQDGGLLQLAQYWGRFISWPPELHRPLLGVGFTLDACSAGDVQALNEFLRRPMPIVLWAHLVSHKTHKKLVELLGRMLQLLATSTSPRQARQFLTTFSSYGCVDGAEERLRTSFLTTWRSEVGDVEIDLTPLDISDTVARLPTRSVTVNGQVLVSDASGTIHVDKVEALCVQAIEEIVGGIRYGQVAVDADDDSLVSWQYGLPRGHLSRVWHPAFSAKLLAAQRHNPLPVATIAAMLGGMFTRARAPEAPVAAHVLLLSDPDADLDDDDGPLASHITFLSAYAEHFSRPAAAGTTRFLALAVAGGCGEQRTETSLAGVLRRCLLAATGRVGHVGEASAVDVSTLGSVVVAWEKASARIREIRRRGSAASLEQEAVLQECHLAASNSGRWAEPAVLQSTALSIDEDELLCTLQAPALETAGTVSPGEAYLMINGRQVGSVRPLHDGVTFTSGIVSFVEQLEFEYGASIRRKSTEDEIPPFGDVMVRLRAALDREDPLRLAFALGVRERTLEEIASARRGAGAEDDDSGGTASGDSGPGMRTAFGRAPPGLKLHLPADEEHACPFFAYVVIEPLGSQAQRLPAVLRVLHEELNVEVGVLLRPQHLVKAPVGGYFRVALAPPAPGGLGALLSWEGRVSPVRFSVPQRRGLLVSAVLHTPHDWLCSAVDSGGADLDSLDATVEGLVAARYALEAVFVEGFASLEGHGGLSPAAGRQLTLAPLGHMASSAALSGGSSLVVRSGYFQLRGPPGLYQLTVQGSEDEYLLRPTRPVELLELGGRGASLTVRVASTTGTRSSRTPSHDARNGPEGAFDGAGGDHSVCKETIHIFSVASGHRYERLLRIMIMSVREHTKCPLRLWLVENFLSPNFRKILHLLAEDLGFAVSLVTYKWPSWLRVQTEKQRVIWAYKILFLDVFFPLEVKRVLFIDADQIVRADVQELWNMNLGGRVYGFTPFCGSGPQSFLSSLTGGTKEAERNPETVGFRFWESGFWEKLLGSSRYYHISALFVVDLVAFRKVGAGNVLRDNYQQLTMDPSSLANLDQDLPNYVQDKLPIFSLPPEWLWCETWCSEATKSLAKTIDMCQNPVRKEGKLQQARRIAPEWVEYDTRLERMIEAMNESA